jgi:hypothetical protein
MSKPTTKVARTSRADEQRVKNWEPPQKLETPPPPDGWKYRWVRRELVGTDEDQNVYGRMRQGYEVVRAEEIRDIFPYIDTVKEGKHTGVVRNGDLILMKVPLHIVEQRNAYYEELTRKQEAAVNQELLAKDNDVMPVSREHKSRVIRGQPVEERNVEFDDD